MTWPSWTEALLGLGGLGGAVAWVDQRFGLSRDIKTLKAKVETAEAEVEKTKQASDTAICEKNNELTMIREDRDQWREKARYWQDQSQHLESLIAARQEGRR